MAEEQKMITCRVPVPVHRHILQAAAAQGVTASMFLRTLILAHVPGLAAPPGPQWREGSEPKAKPTRQPRSQQKRTLRRL